MNNRNPYLISLPKGCTVKQLDGGLNIIEYSGEFTLNVDIPPEYTNSPLYRAINCEEGSFNDKTEKNTELSQGRLGKLKGYNSKVEESGEKIAENYKGIKK